MKHWTSDIETRHMKPFNPFHGNYQVSSSGKKKEVIWGFDWQKLSLRGLSCYDVKFKKFNLFSIKKDKSEGGLLL